MLIAARNAMMSGKRLPYDAEVEYLESTGTQWIATGIIPDNSTGIKASMNVPQPSSTWKSWGGCRRSSGASAYGFSMQYQSQYCPNGRMTVGGATTTTLKPDFSIIGDCQWNYVVSGETGTLTVNGTIVGTRTSSSVWSTNTEMIIFAGNNGGQKNENSSGFKIYRVVILSESHIVRDYQPVRFTNELGVSEGAMYDKRGVGGMNPDGSARNDGLYRNRGTGGFIIGPDI